MEIVNRYAHTDDTENATRRHRAASNILFDFRLLQDHQQQQQTQLCQPRQRTPSIIFPPTPLSQKHRSSSHQDATRPRNSSIFKGATFLFHDQLLNNSQLESQENIVTEQLQFIPSAHYCQKKYEMNGILREQKFVQQSGRLHSQNQRQQVARKSAQNVSSIIEQEKQSFVLTEQDKNRVSMKEYVMELQDNKVNNPKTPTAITSSNCNHLKSLTQLKNQCYSRQAQDYKRKSYYLKAVERSTFLKKIHDPDAENKMPELIEPTLNIKKVNFISYNSYMRI